MSLRLPSLGTVLTAALRTVRRFPLVLLAGALAATASILINDDVGPPWLRDPMLATAALGLPLLTAVALTVERRTWKPILRLVPWALALAALVGVYTSWPGWSDRIRFVRFVQLAAAFHLAVAYLPFLGRYRANAFWQFNRALFLRIIGAGIASGTLFAGLALALAAVDKLFGVSVPEEGYFRLWVLIVFVVSTGVFLGGVPEDLEALDARHDYPAPLRVFAQYILVPLVSVYLVILTLYLVKVVATWDWPSGWIGWLVSGVAAAGILTLLLVRPIAEDPEQRWVAAFARVFWLAAMPAVVMLWLALYQRVQQYGITEPRYFLLVLSVWLAGIAVWYSLSRSGDMRLVPLSLCVVALLSYAGPWGAYAVSARSQVSRLRSILERNGMLVAGIAHAPARRISTDDAREISSVVRYLAETHGTARLATLFPDSVARRLDLGTRRGRLPERDARAVALALEVPYVEELAMAGHLSQYFSASASGRAAIPVADFDLLLRVRPPSDSASADSGLVAFLVPDAQLVRVRRGSVVLVEVPLDSPLVRARRHPGRRAQPVPPEELHASAQGASARADVWLEFLEGVMRADRVEELRVRGNVLVDLRP